MFQGQQQAAEFDCHTYWMVVFHEHNAFTHPNLRQETNNKKEKHKKRGREKNTNYYTTFPIQHHAWALCQLSATTSILRCQRAPYVTKQIILRRSYCCLELNLFWCTCICEYSFVVVVWSHSTGIAHVEREGWGSGSCMQFSHASSYDFYPNYGWVSTRLS